MSAANRTGRRSVAAKAAPTGRANPRPERGASQNLCGLFLENQFQTPERFYARWLAAIFLYLYRQGIERPWVAVAVFPTRSIEPPLSPVFTALEPAGLLHRVYLEELLDQGDGSHLSPGVRLLRLVVLDTEAHHKPPGLGAEEVAALRRAQPQG